MKSRFSIEGVFKAVDRFSAPIRRMEQRLGRATRGMDGHIRGVAGAARALRTGFVALGAVAVAAVVGIGAALRDVINVGAEFEQTITSTASKFTEPIRRGTEAFRQLEDAAKEVGANTEFTATQGAQALQKLAMAGFTAEQAVAALGGSVDFATATGITDLGRATDISTDLLGSFGLASADAAVQARNLAHINDVLARTTASANVDVEDLFASMTDAGPVARGLGHDIRDVAAMAAVLGNAGIKNAEAGTAMRNAMGRLAAPIGEAATAMRRLGIASRDAEGNYRGNATVLGELREALDGMGSARRTGFLKRIFGEEGFAAGNILLEGVDNLRSFRAALEDVTGATEEMAQMQRDTTSGDLAAFNSAVEAMKLEAFDAVREPLRDIVQGMTEWVRANKDWIKTGITDALSWLEENSWAIKVALVAVAAAAAAVALLFAFMAVSVLVMALPLILLIGLVYLIIEAWGYLSEVVPPIIDDIGETLSGMWEHVTDAFTSAWEFVVGLFAILRDTALHFLQPIFDRFASLARWVSDKWAPIGAFFGRLWDGIAAQFGEMWGAIMGKAGSVVDALKAIWAPIGDFFTGLWDGIVQTFVEAFGWVIDRISEAVSFVQGVGRAELERDEHGSALSSARAPAPQMINTTAASIERSFSEHREHSEVTIRDETGRAEVTRRPRQPRTGLRLQRTGAL